MYSRLSHTANNVLTRAANEASLVQHEYQEPVHLLLALLMVNDNPAYRVLKQSGMQHVNVRSLVKAMKYIPPFIGPRVVEKFSPRSKAIIKGAERLAHDTPTAPRKARPGHLLIALINSRDVDTMKVFKSLGVDPDAVLRTISEEVTKEDKSIEN